MFASLKRRHMYYRDILKEINRQLKRPEIILLFGARPTATNGFFRISTFGGLMTVPKLIWWKNGTGKLLPGSSNGTRAENRKFR